MSDQDLHKLLGGYATNTLTDEERNALFAAALHDQQLFDALANEQALKELLEDPAARSSIVAALSTPAVQETTRPGSAIFQWFRRPTNLGLAGSLATALIAILAVNYFSDEANFPTSKQVRTEDRSMEVESSPNRSSQQDIPAPPFDVQESPSEDKRKLSDVASEPLGTTHPETSSPQTSPTEQTMSKMKNRSVQEKKRAKALQPPENSRSLPKRAQSKNKKDSSQELPINKKGQEQLEARQESRPSAGSPPLEPSRSRQPSPPKSSTSELNETDHKESQGTSFQDVMADHDHMTSKTMGARLAQGNARDIFYAAQGVRDNVADSTSKFGAASESEPQPKGLRYSVIKRDAQGAFKEVPPEDPFSPADELRLTIEVNQEGFIYVLQEKESRSWRTIYPTLNTLQSEQHMDTIKPYHRMTIPENGILSIEKLKTSFHLLIVFSYTQLPELQDQLKEDVSPEHITALLSHAKGEGEVPQQTVERVSLEQREQATYIVATSPQGPSTLFVEVSLPMKSPSKP